MQDLSGFWIAGFAQGEAGWDCSWAGEQGLGGQGGCHCSACLEGETSAPHGGKDRPGTLDHLFQGCVVRGETACWAPRAQRCQRWAAPALACAAGSSSFV